VDGLLVVDKPAGPTSHDIVARVRAFVRPSRVGHTGTLDPFATGVLALCIGTATRLARFVGEGSKEYTGEIALCTETDTYDAAGRVTFESPDAPSQGAVIAVASALTGEITQVPPPWSAKKVAGERAYTLARRGEKPELSPCRVRVESFEILAYRDRRASFKVVCSGGTYVRSLAFDLGRALGCGAHLASLRRTRNGTFREADSHSMPTIEAASRAGGLDRLIRPLQTLDLGLPSVTLTEAAERLAVAGRVVPAQELAGGRSLPDGDLVKMVAADGVLVGIGEFTAPGLHPRVVLPRPTA